jgi:NAD kinase
MPAFDKVVIVTKKTALEELVERFNTFDQARFYVEHMGASFHEYEDAHRNYTASVNLLRAALPGSIRSHWIERGFLPTYTFGRRDMVVTLGPDGLVVNTAKYLANQPLLALNPDPARIDGILVAFHPTEARKLLESMSRGEYDVRRVTMAVAELNDGQRLFAVNDLFLGQKTHVSARYTIRYQGREESQSSSGIIVSTGAGSTGWFRSVLAGSTGIVSAFAKSMNRKNRAPLDEIRNAYAFDWEAEVLKFSVREPFASKVSSTELVFGEITRRRPLEIVSEMPQNGVIFSDGIEADNLEFNSGSIVKIGVADRKLHLVKRAEIRSEPDRTASDRVTRWTGREKPGQW